MTHATHTSHAADQAAPVQCPVCGYRFPAEEMPERGCRLCPLKNGCDALVCPNCGYCMPQSTRVETFMRRLFDWVGGKLRRTAPPSSTFAGAVRLTDLHSQDWGQVVEIQAPSPTTVARLGGLCILPGVVFQLRQRQPAYVLRVEETTVALERQLAEWIWVMPLQPEQAGGRQSLTLLPLIPPSCPTLPTTNGADGNGHGA